MDQYYLFLILAPIAAIFTTFAGFYAWRRRLVQGALILSLDLFCVTGWLLSNMGEMIGPSAAMSLASAKFTYIFVASAPVFWIGFALQYTGRENWVSFPRFAFFWILPLITFILVQTNEMHQMIWSVWQIEPVNADLQILHVQSYGPWFWVNVVYSYTLMFVGAALIVFQHFRSTAFYRKQSSWLVVGALSPLLFNLVYIFRVFPALKKDLSPLAFAFAGIAFAIGIFRYGLLDLMPIARDTIIENMQSGMLVIDDQGRLLDFNPVARKLFLPTEDRMIGDLVEKHLPEIRPLLPKDDQSSRAREFTIRRGQLERNFEGKLSGLRDKNGKKRGFLLILQDITERKKLYAEVTRLATQDSLTGLHNRRHLIDLAQQELNRSYRYRHPVSLLVIDIDYFKDVNDTYGHLVGDQVLIGFSRFLTKTLRNVDIVGRIGGDEFVIVLPETLQETARTTGERLCRLIESNTCQTTKGDVKFTISVGVSSDDDVKKDADLYALIERADRALYRAKDQGRNQVAVANGS